MYNDPPKVPSTRQSAGTIALILMLVITLFPFAWLGELFPAFGDCLEHIFATEMSHAIGHSIMFFTLGLLVLAVFPLLRTRPGLYVGLILLAGIGQEAFQLLYKQRSLVFDDARDMGVDLGGLLIAFAVMRGWEYWRRCKARSTHEYNALYRNESR